MVEAGVNNYKMEMLGGSKNAGREVEKGENMNVDEDNGEKEKKAKEEDNDKEEDKGKERDKKQKEQKDKKEEKVRKEKAQFHQQESSSPRLTLPCSGSNWCNILCAGAQQPEQQQNFLSDGTKSEILKSPKSPQFNGAFQLEEDSDIYAANKACNLWIPSYEFQRGHVSNVEFLLDEGFKPKHSENSGDVSICGPGDRNTENMEKAEDESGKQEEGGLLYVTEV